MEKHVCRRSDIWSLGCTLIELASGKKPWNELTNLMQMMQKMDSKELPKIPSHLSPVAQDFIRKCLNYDKEMRPTAMQLL